VSQPKKQTHAITPWKNVAFYLCIVLFTLTLVDYFARGNYGDAQWLWPLLFVPLMLYFLGIMYGDVPSRFYQLSGLQPFPIPFSMQFDRAVLAIVLLFSGITLNGILLAFSVIFGGTAFMITLYVVYMVIVLVELPHSIRIFRYLQHIQIMRMNVPDAASLFENTPQFLSEDSKTYGENQNPAFLEYIFKELKKEGENLVQRYSPLGKEQQYALNLAVRAGEAVWAARAGAEADNAKELETNLNIIFALCKHTDMEPPSDINILTRKLETLRSQSAPEATVETEAAPVS
jgi:hypothetical protein